MARVAMVTRTIITAEVVVLGMNLSTLAVEEKTTTLVGGICDNDTMLKKVKAQLETDTFKAVHIKSANEIETLYGITEEEFIKLAKVLPPRTKTTEAGTVEVEEEAK